MRSQIQTQSNLDVLLKDILKKGDKLFYTDTFGKPRHLTFVKRGLGFVNVKKGDLPSGYSYYTDETGYTLRVPDVAFGYVLGSGIYWEPIQ